MSKLDMMPASEEAPDEVKGYEERTKATAEKKGISWEDLMRSDAGAEDYMRSRQGKADSDSSISEEIINSDLSLEEEENEKNVSVLKGDIKGNKIDFKIQFKSTNRSGLAFDSIINASIDGKPIDPAIAENIYWQYRQAAEYRQSRINELARVEKRKNKEQEALEKVRGEISEM